MIGDGYRLLETLCDARHTPWIAWQEGNIDAFYLFCRQSKMKCRFIHTILLCTSGRALKPLLGWPSQLRRKALPYLNGQKSAKIFVVQEVIDTTTEKRFSGLVFAIQGILPGRSLVLLPLE